MVGALNFKHIFILTYGRSGSTLLQGILNSIPGVLIRGENNAALRGLFNSWRSVTTGKEVPSSDRSSPTSPWFGIQEADIEAYGRDLVSAFIRNVLRPDESTRVLGFKEIRYFPKNSPHLAEEIEFMRRFFSSSAFIINTRNIEEAISSARRQRQRISADQMRASDARLRQLAADGGADIFRVHYDDYVADPDRLRPLFEFLGTPYDKSAVTATMDRVHSSVSSAVAERHLLKA